MGSELRGDPISKAPITKRIPPALGCDLNGGFHFGVGLGICLVDQGSCTVDRSEPRAGSWSVHKIRTLLQPPV